MEISSNIIPLLFHFSDVQDVTKVCVRVCVCPFTITIETCMGLALISGQPNVYTTSHGELYQYGIIRSLLGIIDTINTIIF